jgi:hypothetical protein
MDSVEVENRRVVSHGGIYSSEG